MLVTGALQVAKWPVLPVSAIVGDVSSGVTVSEGGPSGALRLRQDFGMQTCVSTLVVVLPQGSPRHQLLLLLLRCGGR